MYLLLSGEGKSDLGVCGLALDLCDSDNFQPGPMSWIVDQLIEHSQGYEFSHIENNCVSYVSKSYLVTNKPPALQKSMGLPGKKKPLETKYYLPAFQKQNPRCIFKLCFCCHPCHIKRSLVMNNVRQTLKNENLY